MHNLVTTRAQALNTSIQFHNSHNISFSSLSIFSHFPFENPLLCTFTTSKIILTYKYLCNLLPAMGNSCCGGTDVEPKPQRSIAGAPPPANVMTPSQDARREQARLAAEERARQGAVRGTQRYQYVTSMPFFSPGSPQRFYRHRIFTDLVSNYCS